VREATVSLGVDELDSGAEPLGRARRPGGAASGQTGDYPGANQALQEALGLYRDLGDRRGQANVLGDLGARGGGPATTRERPRPTRSNWPSSAT